MRLAAHRGRPVQNVRKVKAAFSLSQHLVDFKDYEHYIYPMPAATCKSGTRIVLKHEPAISQVPLEQQGGISFRYKASEGSGCLREGCLFWTVQINFFSIRMWTLDTPLVKWQFRIMKSCPWLVSKKWSPLDSPKSSVQPQHNEEFFYLFRIY